MDSEIYKSVCDEAIGLLMTYRCNLHCQYCYIKQKQNKDMTLEMAQKIIEPFLIKEGRSLDIIFVGGETLLAIDIIRPLVEWAENGKWGSRFRFFGSTNGTLLTEDIKEWLKKHKQTLILGLSYDGLPSSQINNRGADNIDVQFFIDTWPNQPIQMTINEDSVGNMADGIVSLLEKGAAVHPNVAYEEKEWEKESVSEYGRQLYKLIKYYSEHKGKYLISQFRHDLNEYATCLDSHKEQKLICGAGNGYQVFDVDGRSYPCHILSPLVLTGSKLQRIREDFISGIKTFEDKDCSSCPYTTSCPTCIACNYVYRNCFPKRDKTHCRIMRTEVRACIKSEVMRLQSKLNLTPEDATIIDSIQKLIKYEYNQI